MKLILFIVIWTCAASISFVVAYRNGWWRTKLFNFFAFLLGFGLVYLPLFPYATDNSMAKFLYGIVAGLFMLQAHRILIKHLYTKVEDKKK